MQGLWPFALRHAYPIGINLASWIAIPATAAYLCGTYRIGRFFRKILVDDNAFPWEEGFDLIFGVAGIAGVVVLVGIFTPLLNEAAAIIGVASLLAGLPSYRFLVPAVTHRRWWTPWRVAFVLLGAVFAIAALCPPTHPDELFYKVPLLDRALHDGALLRYESPWYVLQPLASQLYSLPLLALGFPPATALLSLGAFIAMALCINSESSRRQLIMKSNLRSAAGVLLLLSPWAIAWCSVPGNDTWSTFSITIATCLACESLTNPTLWGATLVAVAAALTIKSGALIPGALIALFAITSTRSRADALGKLRAAVVATLLLLPWMIRSFRDWHVFSPDPIYWSVGVRNLDAACLRQAIRDSLRAFTLWPRTPAGLFGAPYWIITHRLGILNIGFGPLALLLIGRGLGTASYRQKIFIAFYLCGVCLSLHFFLPHFPRYIAGSILGVACFIAVQTTKFSARATRALIIAAAIYLSLVGAISANYLRPYLHYVFSRQSTAEFLDTGIQCAEARHLLASTRWAPGNVITNFTELLYTGRITQTIAESGGAILDRRMTDFTTGAALGDYLRRRDYTYILWGGPDDGVWTELFHSAQLLYDNPDTKLTGGKDAALRGRTRIYRI